MPPFCAFHCILYAVKEYNDGAHDLPLEDEEQHNRGDGGNDKSSQENVLGLSRLWQPYCPYALLFQAGSRFIPLRLFSRARLKASCG